MSLLLFLSTCPVRGTTRPKWPLHQCWAISIHVPREGHDPGGGRHKRRKRISIHVPREGHDVRKTVLPISWLIFLSTCPVRGTTSSVFLRVREFVISIHVPREGHDSHYTAAHGGRIHFYPRAP